MNLRSLHNSFTTINRRYEKVFLTPVYNAIDKVRKDTIRAIRYYGNVRDGISELNKVIHNPELSKVIRDLYVTVGLRHAQINYSRMRVDVRTSPRSRRKDVVREVELKSAIQSIKGFGFNQEWTDFITSYLQRFLLEQITFDVATTTRDKLIEVLQQAIREGWGIDETVKNLEDLPFLKFQAARIVRTEINRAANVGAKAQSETFGYEQMKEWISAEDDRVRGTEPKDHASHVSLDGQRINEGDLFKDPRNGDLLEFPGDPRASAASTINCRCSIAYVAKRDPNGRLIPKRQTTAVIFPNQNRTLETTLV